MVPERPAGISDEDVYLDRFIMDDQNTIGILTHNGRALAFTLEPSIDADEHPAIPAGDYRLTWRAAGRIGQLYRRRGFPGSLQLDVPHREAIEIHAGNTFRDTEGCILLGDSTTPIGTRPVSLMRSRIAVDRFYRWAENRLQRTGIRLHVMTVSGYDFDDR